MKDIRQVEFSKLRYAYITIKNFIESESGDKVQALNTKIAQDLGLTGDDNYFLLGKFVEKFELEYTEFEYDKHFYSEAELYDSTATLLNLFVILIWLPFRTIELLTINKLSLPKPTFYKPDREVSDMTFRDLLTWYIEGKYVPSTQVKYEIRPKLNEGIEFH